MVGIGEQGRDAVAQRRDVAFREDQPGVADHVRDLAAIRADHRHAASHGLDQHASELLLPVRSGERRQDQRVEGWVDVRHLRGGASAEEIDPVADTQRACQCAELGALRSVPHDGEPPAHIRQPGARAQQQIDAFLRDQRAGVADDEGRRTKDEIVLVFGLSSLVFSRRSENPGSTPNCGITATGPR